MASRFVGWNIPKGRRLAHFLSERLPEFPQVCTFLWKVGADSAEATW